MRASRHDMDPTTVIEAIGAKVFKSRARSGTMATALLAAAVAVACSSNSNHRIGARELASTGTVVGPRASTAVEPTATAVAGDAPARLAFRQNVVDAVVSAVGTACTPTCPAEVAPIGGPGELVVGSSCEFPRTEPDQHLVTLVRIARAGRLIDWSEGGESLLLAAGVRSRPTPLVAGPGGSSFGVEFTTEDGCLDVEVSLANLLPVGVEIECGIDGLARNLAATLATRRVTHDCLGYFEAPEATHPRP